MDDQRKRAYRYLLYRAMIDIRGLSWIRLGPWSLLIPWRRRETLARIRLAGGIADWLHNLAAFVAWDFEGFDEARFWDEFEWFTKRFPGEAIPAYKRVFEQVLTGTESPF